MGSGRSAVHREQETTTHLGWTVLHHRCDCRLPAWLVFLSGIDGLLMLNLLKAMTAAGLLGFGGGSAMIPIIEDQLVNKHSLVSAEEFNRQVVVVNITPGAQPPKLGALNGLQTGGILAAILASLVISLPSVLGAFGLLSLGSSGSWITLASVGISVVIIVMMSAYIARVLKAADRRRRTFWWIILATVLLSGLGNLLGLIGTLIGRDLSWGIPRLSTPQIIALALAIIVVVSMRQKANPIRFQFASLSRYLVGSAAFLGLVLAGIAVCWTFLGLDGLMLGGRLALSAVTSFGGGPAYLGVAAGYFVDSGLISSELFYTQLVPVASALPGPILVKVAAGVAFIVGGEQSVVTAWALGLAAMLIVTGACVAVLLPIFGAYDQLKDHPVFQNISNFMLAVICGLLINTAISMLKVSAEIGASSGHSPTLVIWLSLLGIGVCYLLHHRKLVPDIVLILGCGALSVFALSL